MNLMLSDVRSLVTECLRRERPYNPAALPFRVHGLFGEVAKLAKDRELRTPSGNHAWLDNRSGLVELHPHLQVMVWDVVWDLIVEGVLRPGADEREMELPAIHVTNYGKEVLGGDVTPYDPERFLSQLAAKVPTADPVITRYVAESAETLRRNCLLSSTITLGAASEKAFLVVAEAFAGALNTADQAKFQKEFERARSIKLQHGEFKKWYERHLRPRLAREKQSDWISSLDDSLHFVFTYFRTVRNDAGHPSGAVFSREQVHSHLVIFPYYLRVLYDLVDWLAVNKPI